jgi:GTPase
MRSRLTGSYKGMDRIRGGIGIKGPGETKLEIDRRTIGRRISRLKGELKNVEKHIRLVYESRKDADTVSIVGYTNAGKTSLLNTLTGSAEKAEDLLFSTVEVRSRRMEDPSGRGIVLSDTIGFIRDLPHHLVESFKTTLMDIKFAGLVLIVLDISSPFVEEHLRTVRKTLEELGCADVPSLIVYNKIDRLDPGSQNRVIDGCIRVSTRTGEGVEELRERIFGFFKT